jgi:molybdopterin converting factor small subunit
MSITIELASYLRPYAANRDSVLVNGKTVGECLERLVTEYPDIRKMIFAPDGKLHGYVSVFAGGAMSAAEDLSQPIKDGETLHVLYVIGGG